MRLLRDRHAHALLLPGPVRGLSGAHALGDLSAQSFEDLLSREALRQELADGAVAGVFAHAGHDEIADAGKTGDGERVRAAREAVACDLRQPPRDEACFRVVAVAHAVDGAGAQRDHVLQRAAELDPDDIGIRVRAEHRRAEERLEPLRRFRLRRCDHRRRGMTGRDLAADVRSGEHRNAPRVEHLRPELGHAPTVTREPLRRGQHVMLRS